MSYSCEIIFESDKPYKLFNIPAITESQASGITIEWALEAGRKGKIHRIIAKKEKAWYD